MNNFDEIIRQKVEHFEVPYNDAHWAEMEGKLNSIRALKIKKNIFGTIGAIAILSIAGYFIYNNNQTIQKNNDTVVFTETTENVIEDNTISNNEIKNNNTDKIVANNIVAEEKTSEETSSEKITEETTNETNKIAETKTIVEEKIKPTTNEVETNTISLNAEFIVYNNKVCLGEEVSFEALSKNSPVSYTWNFGDGTTSKKANPTHIYNESGKYDVTLTLINRKTGNEISHTERNSIVILPQPKAEFGYAEISLSQDDNKLKYPFTEFNSKDIETTNTYIWNFGNGDKSTSQNPKTIYKKKGDYQVMLTVKNNYGCLNSITKDVTIAQDFDLYAPNAFTPNNNGGNEFFIPKALLGWEVQFEMTIIDKTTKVIYKTTDKNEPWNGRINNNGALLNEDLYFWQVITYDAEGTLHRHHGQVTLIR